MKYINWILNYPNVLEIQSRKERSNMMFDTSQYSPFSALMTEENVYDEDDAVS